MAPEQFIFYICKTAYIMGTGIIIIYYETDLQFYLCTNQPNNRIIFLFLISSNTVLIISWLMDPYQVRSELQGSRSKNL